MNSHKRMSLFSSGFILLLLFTTGCYYDQVYVPPAAPPVEDISFAADVEPIFYTGDKCTSCHSPSGSASWFDLSQGNAYTSIIGRDLVNLDDPASSTIYIKPQSHYQSYTADEAAIVLKWIEDGAPKN